MKRWHRFWRLAPAYLHMTARREWQLIMLAFVGLAPGVAALFAWSNLAWQLSLTPPQGDFHHWLLPLFLLRALGPPGILVGAGVATLLIGCLGVANAYLASVERRLGELALLQALGLSRLETASLLLIEVLVIGILGSAVGLGGGVLVSWLAWPSAQQYFQLAAPWTIHPWLLRYALLAGLLAALLFMGLSVLVSVLGLPHRILRGQQRSPLLNIGRARRTTVTGTLFATLLTLSAALPILGGWQSLLLTGLALGLSALLSWGSWLLTWLYRQLPQPAWTPLWDLALQGLARHPRHTAGMTLALTTGAYSLGLAAFTWLDGPSSAGFAFWVAGITLIAGATLVLTAAFLAALERRQEYGLLIALGARRQRLWRLILLEYAIVAIGGGSLGALMALTNWALSDGRGGWGLGSSIVLADMLGALTAAWLGAAPVLWRVTRRARGSALHQSPINRN